ncbi:hypothetical protein [Eudoraea sp.]|uniref:hypothetical protein n=1 Tax=Eudoraea sp. TaxID=1979955 RepID=UPI003C71AF05
MTEDIVFFVTDDFGEYFPEIKETGIIVHFVQTHKQASVPSEKPKNHHQTK